MNKITLGFFRTKSKTTLKTVLTLFVLLLMNTQTSWGQGTLSSPIFSENFSSLADATALTTSNTTFSFIRVGTSTTVNTIVNEVIAKNPSSFTGASALIGAKGTSISTIDKTGLTSFSSGTFTFKFKTPSSLTSAVMIGAVGAGATFGSSNGFSGTQLSSAFQVNGTNLQIRSAGVWTTVQTVAVSTAYIITIVFNNTAGSLNYGDAKTLASNKCHIWVDGVYVGEYAAATNNLAASAFRIYTTTAEFEVDDVAVYNSLPTASVTTDWCNLQAPITTQNILEGGSFNVYARAYEPGLTEATGAGVGLSAWIGYSAINENPNGVSWTWIPATFNVQVGNDDEFTASLGSGIVPGAYYFASRFQIGTGLYTYGGTGGVWNNDSVALNVASNLVNYCNVQWPLTGTITQGDTYNVFAQVYDLGITEAAGKGTGITSWIGHSTTDTNPNTGSWTWVSATYNTDSGNNDEYIADIAVGLTSGTYYYASRFKKTGSTEYVYGGTNGSPWSTSGTLTVNAAVPVVSAGSPIGTVGAAFTYNISATNSPTSYAVSSGTLPAGLTLNSTTGAITGTPTTVGSSSVDVTATNPGGTSVAATLSFTIGIGSQIITFAALTSQTYGVLPYTLTGSSTSGLTVDFASDNLAVATVSGTTITIVGAGTANITASQAGDANYNPAIDVIQSLIVNAKALTITGVTANNKIQDGSATATLSGTPSLVAIETADIGNVMVGGTPTATFASSAVGTGIAVSVSGYTLGGSAAANYTLTQPTLAADITALSAPVATAGTSIAQTQFNANWNTVSDANNGYLLDVSTSASFDSTIISENFSGFTINNGTTDRSAFLDTYLQTTGWTGVSIFEMTGYAKLGAGSTKGIITTPTLNLSVNGGVSTLTFDFAKFGSDTGLVQVFHAADGVNFVQVGSDLIPPATLTTQTVAISGGTINSKIRIQAKAAASSRFYLDNVTISYSDIISGYNAKPIAGQATITSLVNTNLTDNTTYYYRVRAVNGTAVSANSNTISLTTKPASVTWNGAAWSNTTGPDATIEAIIAGTYNTNVGGVQGPFTAKKLTVNSGSLTVNSGTNITVLNELVNNLAATAIVVESNANLFQNGTTNNNVGDITVNRDSSPLFRLDYTMWSSPLSKPVVTQSLFDFSPLTTTERFYIYNEGTDKYNAVDPSATKFEAGKGYLIRMPNNWVAFGGTAASWTGTFTGTPNNGDITYTMTMGLNGYNAVGNPYPSTLNIDDFINGNSGNIDLGTLWFWRKTNDAVNPVSYSTCTTAGITSGNTHTYPNDNFISVGQGFIVKATSTTLNFTNSMRVANNQNQFFKTKQIERNRIWLNLSNATSPVNQMMVAYMTGATQGIDAAIDGRYFNDSATALNSLISNEEFAIQGRNLPFDGTDVVPLAFKTEVAGDFTIAIDHVDGLFSGSQDVFLKDNTTGTETDLKAGSYTFTAAAGVDNARFSLKYQKTLKVDAPTFNENSVTVYKNKGTLYVNSGAVAMANIKVFDIQGRLIAEQKNVKANTAIIKDLKATHQVLIVKITSQDNTVVTKKVVN